MKTLKKIGAGILFIVLAVGLGALIFELAFHDWKAGAMYIIAVLGSVVLIVAILAAVGGCYWLLKYIFGED